MQSIDPTCAGDSFDGAFICGLLEGINMAAAAGALNTMAQGPMEGDISCESVMRIMKGGIN